MYDLPQFDSKKIKDITSKVLRNKTFKIGLASMVFFTVLVFYVGMFSTDIFRTQINGVIGRIQQNFLPLPIQDQPIISNILKSSEEKYVSPISHEQAIINSVREASPSVVSIVISKNLPVYQQQFINPFGDNSPFGLLVPEQVQKGTKYQEVGAGSGFIVSEDGLVLTNKHVVSDKIADYTVFTNDGKKYKAKVSALDPVQDLAIIKIQVDKLPVPAGQNPADVPVVRFPSIKIGNSDGIQIGQGVIAIGNALGQFSNTVSVGVVSGLGRTVSASGA